MRLARGSGLDGLTAMAEQRAIGEGCVLLRPLLGVSGARLRATLRTRSATWVEDPSNDAERFERVRLRKARALLASLGLTNDKIALSARRLERARSRARCRRQRLEERRAPRSARRRLCQLRSRCLAGSARGVARCVSSRGLIASYGGQAEPLRLVQLEALADRMASRTSKEPRSAGAIVSRHGERRAHPARARPGAAAGGYSATRSLRRVGRAISGAAPLPRRAAPSRCARSGRKPSRTCASNSICRADLPARAAATLPAFWRAAELIIVPVFRGCCPACPPLGGPRCGSIRPNSLAKS